VARALIFRRLDAALDAMEARGMNVRAIYLTDDDWAAYDAAQSKAFGRPIWCFQYSGFEIHSGQASRVYSTHGVALAVPKRLPKCAC